MLKETGYTIKDACNALSVSRSSYYSAKEVRVIEWVGGDLKDGELVRRIKGIKAEHPFWG